MDPFIALLHQAGRNHIDEESLLDLCSALSHTLIKVAPFEITPHQMAKRSLKSLSSSKKGGSGESPYAAIIRHFVDSVDTRTKACSLWVMEVAHS